MTVDRALLLTLYRRMLLTRRIEETHNSLLRAGKCTVIGHFGEGQEAVGIGVTAPLRPDDFLFPTHRGAAEYIGKGMRTVDILSEYLLRATSPTKGKGGFHLCDMRLNIVGLPGSLGADFGMSVGAAFAALRRGTGQVAMAFFGEGCAQQPDLYAALNMAALWQAPLVFALVNNEYAEQSHYMQTSSSKDLAPRAAGFGVPYSIVADGNDVETVYTATAEAVEHARSGKGPILLEYKTYRISAHYNGDPQVYQPREEIEAWRKKDPIARTRARLLAAGCSEAELDAVVQSVAAEVEAARKEALAAPVPDPSELYTDVFCEA